MARPAKGAATSRGQPSTSAASRRAEAGLMLEWTAPSASSPAATPTSAQAAGRGIRSTATASASSTREPRARRGRHGHLRDQSRSARKHGSATSAPGGGERRGARRPRRASRLSRALTEGTATVTGHADAAPQLVGDLRRRVFCSMESDEPVSTSPRAPRSPRRSRHGGAGLARCRRPRSEVYGVGRPRPGGSSTPVRRLRLDPHAHLADCIRPP